MLIPLTCVSNINTQSGCPASCHCGVKLQPGDTAPAPHPTPIRGPRGTNKVANWFGGTKEREQWMPTFRHASSARNTPFPEASFGHKQPTTPSPTGMRTLRHSVDVSFQKSTSPLEFPATFFHLCPLALIPEMCNPEPGRGRERGGLWESSALPIHLSLRPPAHRPGC